MSKPDQQSLSSPVVIGVLFIAILNLPKKICQPVLANAEGFQKATALSKGQGSLQYDTRHAIAAFMIDQEATSFHVMKSQCKHKHQHLDCLLSNPG